VSVNGVPLIRVVPGDHTILRTRVTGNSVQDVNGSKQSDKNKWTLKNKPDAAVFINEGENITMRCTAEDYPAVPDMEDSMKLWRYECKLAV
jgi:hypothetical protein